MGPMVIVALGLMGALVLAALVFAGSLALVPARTALRVGMAAAMGAAVGFIATAVAQMPVYPQTGAANASYQLFLGTSGVAGLAAGLIAAWIILKAAKRSS